MRAQRRSGGRLHCPRTGPLATLRFPQLPSNRGRVPSSCNKRERQQIKGTAQLGEESRGKFELVARTWVEHLYHRSPQGTQAFFLRHHACVHQLWAGKFGPRYAVTIRSQPFTASSNVLARNVLRAIKQSDDVDCRGYVVNYSRYTVSRPRSPSLGDNALRH